MFDFILGYRDLIIEILGVLTGLIYLYYSVNEKIELWIWGFLSSGFTFLSFFLANLYSEAFLQIYYLIISVYGWYIWKFGVSRDHTKKYLHIKRVSTSEWKQLIAVFLLLYGALLLLLIYAPALLGLGSSQLPYLDGFCTAASIVGTWMLSRKHLENWIVWIIVDALSVGITLYKELYFYSFLFVIYTIVAILGYMKWRDLSYNRVDKDEK